MNNFGTGKTLKEASPQLQEDAERHSRILEVAERDSVIEGLPPFTEQTRERFRKQLEALASITPEPVSEPAE
jgi:hypothetical protein